MAEYVFANGDVGVSLGAGVAVRLPAPLAAQLEALALHGEARQVGRGLRELIARHGDASNVMAQAMIRYAGARHPGGSPAIERALEGVGLVGKADSGNGLMLASLDRPGGGARARAGDRVSRASGGAIGRLPSAYDASQRVGGLGPGMELAGDATQQYRELAPLPSDSLDSFEGEQASMGRTADATLLSPLIGSVAPVLRRVASPVLP
ncbi:hypothetical protein [Ferruginivarius sediminum]|uniref:Uncharacterized protein n=1 Tax=Ferruginivarius sediminum TaxID=2661937 RepID=A0A369TCY2_9PROT|nr:hypothetical protein [Ferruginivarius sediminum]RDD63169.1 hypothetical protein DRB17_05235 [Ferruginivarius sediminum]